jgi:hypothetical protein
MAYSIVAACVLLLKHEVDDNESKSIDNRAGLFRKIWNSEQITYPTKFTSGLATIIVSLYAVFCMWMSLVISLMGSKILDGNALAIVLLVIPIIAIIVLMTVLVRQPKSSKKLSFSVPFTPWFPALSIMINIYMMSELDFATWIRFGVWLAIGLCIYVFYGRKNSILKNRVAIEPMERVALT